MSEKPNRSLREPLLPELSLEDLESRLESTCLDFDPCLGSFCWQFLSEYACGSQCTVHCHPFFGCHPYCHE